MIRILNIEPEGYCDEARDILTQLGEVVETPLQRIELLKKLPGYDVLIVRLTHQIDREVIDAGSCLKIIVTATTGLDHIDMDYARSKGITVLSLYGETEFLSTVNATAEYTWALLLALIRRIPQAFFSVKSGNWNRDSFRGSELYGKHLGIVGLGRIGRKVAGYGLAFDMKVSAFDPYVEKWVDGVVKMANLSELLRCSEVLLLHVPLSSETTGIIGTEEIHLLPRGAVLINTSRGELIDEKALIRELERKHLAGAAVDVITHERNSEQRQNNPLFAYAGDNNNLIITPHIAGATYESMAKTEVFMARKLTAFLNTFQKEGKTL
jgi:D-3-phosphoglycerate dehydrogenase